MTIFNGSLRPLSMSTASIPNMSDALDSWFVSISVSVVTKTVDQTTFNVTEVLTAKTIQAVKQALSSRDLQVKPEGQRAWSWEQLHVKEGDVFNLDDVVIISNVRYRIMNKWDRRDYGYYEYHICQDFTP